MADLKKLLEEVKALTVVEVKMLEEEFGVSASAPVAMMAGPAQAEAAEEKAEFDVVLAAIDSTKKIATIKVVREITGLGLAQAKGLVDGAPTTLKEAVPTATANEYKEKLVAVGATVELK
jgi:large subunit ribosomal protein L7/L12